VLIELNGQLTTILKMLLAGVAEQLEEAVYFDKYNNQLDYDCGDAVGIKSNIIIIKPSYILFFNKTGSSTNIKKDKMYNQKVIAEKGFSGTKEAISSDVHYTTMGFTAATGEPVMCCLIFLSEK
jgi:hypothetical protein